MTPALAVTAFFAFTPAPWQARAAAARSALAAIEPSIVTIETVGGAQPVFETRGGPREVRFRVAEGPTTGLILSSEGLIITSSFNFVRDPTVITVVLSDGRRFVARLLGRDLIRRLALLRIDASGLSEPNWIPASELAVGQYAIACGRGLGGERPHISIGIISALARRNGNAVQTDAKTSPVNYGGPLVDIEGRVIGVIVPMAGAGSALAGAEWYDSGIGFAIVKPKIDLVLGRLRKGEIIEPGRIGVVLESDGPSDIPLLDKIFPATPGVRIRAIARPSPAEKADLKVGDKITGLDGQPVGNLPDLQRRLSDRAAGETLRLSIKRRWRSFEVSIILARSADIRLEPEQPASAPTGDQEDETPALPSTRPSE